MRHLVAAGVGLLLSAAPAWAQTRFYFPSTGAAAVSPAYGAGWVQDPAVDRRALVTTRISSAFAQVGTGDTGDTLGATNTILRQYVSAPLAAQTVTGTLKGQFRGKRAGSSDTISATLAIRVAKVGVDGTTVTEIVAITGSTNTAAAPPIFVTIATALTNRRLEVGDVDDFTIDVPSTGISAGERLIIEIGVVNNQYTSTRFAAVEFGDNSGSDLAEDETSTTQNNPWVEFTHTFTFDGGGGGTSPRGTLVGVLP